MTKYIATLRGINVGGKRKVLMADLKEICKDLGFKNIQTYIQSGNAIFDAEDEEDNDLAATLEAAILASHGFGVPAIVRTLPELKKAHDHNPFLKSEYATIDQLHLTFLSGKPSSENLAKIKTYDYAPDQFEITGDDVFNKIPGKYHESKLTNAFLKKKLELKATTRNWKTVIKLLELVEMKG